ncbi:MAG: hypothetical protein FWE30_00810 [Bacteroidales bacterium]|nr:hypothetical protein [Bacteroidales bacterium]
MIEPALLRPVAEVLKLFGNNGTLIVKFRPHVLACFNQTEPVFALMDGIPVPFFIASFEAKGHDRARILFDSIHREEHALELVGKTLLQQESEPMANKRNQQRLEDPNKWIGFTASDEKLGQLGSVDAFMNWPKNPCLSIRPNKGTASFLVPFQQALIQDIDLKSKHINLILPEGLAEVNG